MILAWYEDEMNSNVFAFNDGLKSSCEGFIWRIWLEGFDKDMEFSSKERTLKGHTDLGLLASTNCGFYRKKRSGHARAVRKMVEQTTQWAMAGDYFDEFPWWRWREIRQRLAKQNGNQDIRHILQDIRCYPSREAIQRFCRYRKDYSCKNDSSDIFQP